MSAEAVAELAADLRARRAKGLRSKAYGATMTSGMLRVAAEQAVACASTVVDATALYLSLLDRPEPVRVYEDHPCIAPPWTSALICYVNEHGNVVGMASEAVEHLAREGALWEDTAEPLDWDQVRWTINTFVWLGGRDGTGTPFPTAGPAHLWQYAVYEDGTPADLHWVHLTPEYPLERWDMASLVLLGTLNFLNCRNVELVEPVRSRGERRRLARTGVVVKTISVFPAGRSARGAVRAGEVGTPLTSVRGHFARYGQDGRGLLFGKHAGRFWIPQHARGSATLGEHVNDYRLRVATQ